jgi:hypothetical protein
MSSIVVAGDTSGTVTLQAPAVAGSTTLTLPATSGTVIVGTSGITPEASGGTGTTTGYYGFKNRIINGAMVIDQRNSGSSYTALTTTYTLDRWNFIASVGTGNAQGTIQQNLNNVTRPAGFSNYIGYVTTSSGANIARYQTLTQSVEGYNVADLNWGTASAQAITVSFWVQSSLTGSFCATLNIGTTATYAFNYTISSANTWTYITLTIPGTAAYSLNSTTNGAAFTLNFILYAGSSVANATANTWAAYSAINIGTAGSVYPGATTSATFYVTGVQLEKGSTATSFDYRPYGTELALCQRYYYQEGGTGTTMLGSGYYRSTGIAYFYKQFSTTMRASPTFSATSGTNYYLMECGASVSVTGNTLTSYNTSPNSAGVYFTVAGGTTSSGCIVMTNSTSAIVGWSAEL